MSKVPAKRTIQYKLAGLNWKSRSTHGGSAAKGNPREHRPVDTKQFLHVVLRSSQARGSQSFLAHLRRVDLVLQRHAKMFGVHIEEASTPGNHMHLLIKVRHRKDLGRFLRSLSGVLARILLGAEKGRPRLTQEKFWDARPWSRIVYVGRDLRGVARYVRQNTLEALGIGRSGARQMIARMDALLRSGELIVPGFG